MDFIDDSLTAFGIEEAHRRIEKFINRTPVYTSTSLDAMISEMCEGGNGPKLYFKCENFQKTGSFKCRGAVNIVTKALEEAKKSFCEIPNGYITVSSGNHGQALAYACSKNGQRCVIVVPEDAPKAKINAIQRFNAQVIFTPGSLDDLIQKCLKIAETEKLTYIHPFDNWSVVEAQGTVAIEFAEQVPEMDAFLLAVGGGSLAAGASQWLSERNPNVKVFCVEPEGKELEKSLKAGKPLWETQNFLETIADGCRARAIGERCFRVIEKNVEHRVFTVTDEEIREAWKLIWQRLKVVVEPCAAMPLAAVMKYPNEFKNFKHIGLVLCGGNVDFPFAV